MFAAGVPGTFSVMGSLLNTLACFGPPNDHERAAAKRYGANILSYANPNGAVEQPEEFRFNYGIRLWQAQYDGFMIYAYQHSMGFIWDDFDHIIYKDIALTYPTAERPIDTLSWEALREGIDDVRYLTDLENALLAGKLSKVRSAEARDFLSKLRMEPHPSPPLVRLAAARLLVSASE